MSDAARPGAQETATSSEIDGPAPGDAAPDPERWLETRWGAGPGRHALLWLGMTGLALFFWHAAFRRVASTGAHDWRFYIQMWETIRVGIQRFGELPLWNPYQCGGVTLWGNPQHWLFSPLFYPTLLLGTALAIKVRLILLNTLGLVGMYVLARRVYRVSPIGALLAAVPWACSGFFSWHNLAGHAPFQTFWLFPWVLYFARRAERDPRFSAASAGVIFFMVIDGATYPLPYLALLMGADALFRSIAARGAAQRLRIVAPLAWTGVLALSLAALRVIPSLSTLRRMPRNLTDHDAIDLSDVLTILTARKHEWRFDPHEYTWHEYACYIGWTVLVLGLLGFVLGVRKRPVLAAGAALFFFCMLGHVAPYFPWPLLKRLPVLESLRIPARFVILFTLYLGLLAAIFLDWLRDRVARLAPSRTWLGTALAATLTVGAIADLFSVNLSVNDIWRGKDLPTEPPSGKYHFVRPVYVHDFRAAYAGFPQQERGSAQCYEALHWPSPQGLWTGDVPQARVSGEGRVLDWGHTTNTLWAEVDLKVPSRVVFNQTFAPGWQSAQGTVVDDAGRIAVDAGPGPRRIELAFRPPEMAVSIGITLVGVVLTLLTAVLARTERLTRLIPARWR